MSKNFETKENLWWRGREIVAAAPQVYIDVDVEADGVAGFGSMLSVGAESVTGASYYSEIRPASSEYIPSNRNFCEQHGLERDRLMDEARPFTEVMSEFYEWTDNERRQCGKQAVFAAFNAGFDWAHTDLYFARAGLANPYGIAPFDIKSLLMSLHGDWDWAKTNKGHLPPEITPDEAFTHHALEDARYQQKIHFGMAALLNMKQKTSGNI